MEIRPPRVSLGLPVFNGSNFLQATIRSIQQQTFQDYEVVISDNASTDQTADICHAYASVDSRVRFSRLSQNRGAAKNFNLVFEQSRGQYFKWIAHDDIIGPEFLAKSVAFLDAHPASVLCQSRSLSIDAQGCFQSKILDKTDCRADTPHERFQNVLFSWHACTMVFGLVRRNILQQTRLIEAHVGSDRSLLAELALLGPLEFIPEYLCSFREHPERSMRKHFEEQARIAWFDPQLAQRPLHPTLRRAIAYRSAITRAPLDEDDRTKCFGVLRTWCRQGMHYNGVSIATLLTRESASALRNPMTDPDETQFARSWLTGDNHMFQPQLTGST